MVSKNFRPNLRAVFGHTQEILTNLCLHFPGKGEKEREGRAEIVEKDKAKRKERRGRERDQITVTDAPAGLLRAGDELCIQPCMARGKTPQGCHRHLRYTYTYVQ